MEEPDYKTIGINIKIKRIRQGISQAKLAKLIRHEGALATESPYPMVSLS